MRAMAESVVHASRRTEALLASLLILARSQRGLLRSEPVDLAAVVEAAAEAADGAARDERVRLRTALEPAAVEGDAALLERLAANLLENAVRYNRPGGFVDISTREGIASAELRVENSGPPVDREAAARLAEPFERLQRQADARGAGLGLSIVRAVSEAHGGSLLIEPRAECGLVVSVRLPRGATAGAARRNGSGARAGDSPASRAGRP
jgi:signal transduction histidine kinase